MSEENIYDNDGSTNKTQSSERKEWFVADNSFIYVKKKGKENFEYIREKKIYNFYKTNIGVVNII